jgi:PH domain
LQGWEEDYKSGFLVKEGGNTKSWKRRWFVVKPSYNVEYYESETVFKSKGSKGKKGLINLCGYWVNTDPNDSVLGRLRRLAERMGTDIFFFPLTTLAPPLPFNSHGPFGILWVFFFPSRN